MGELIKRPGCPLCGGEVGRFIYCGLPLRMCLDDTCSAAWGAGVWAMRLVSNGDHWALWPFEGSYLVALWRWIWHRGH